MQRTPFELTQMKNGKWKMENGKSASVSTAAV
jgi:hypothetical protein